MLTLIGLTGISIGLGADSWSYCSNCADGPLRWTGDCASGKSQSPIDITSTNATYKSFSAWNLQNYGKTLSANFTQMNTGSALKVSIPENMFFVNGGGLDGNYTTAQFHLHWGPSNKKGSEHYLDGQQFSAEIHFVSYNVKYPNLTYAATKSDGLAVLGVFLEVGSANPAYDKFLNYASKVVNKSATVHIPAFPFSPLFPSNTSKFYRYQGSLTTPGCYESVTWTVFHDVVEISSSQVSAMRRLMMNGTDYIGENYRPTQDLHTRTVYASFDVPAATQTPTVGGPVDSAVGVKMSTGLLLLMLFGALFFY